MLKIKYNLATHYHLSYICVSLIIKFKLMKKITLILFLIVAQIVSAQEVVYTTDFTDDTYPGWIFYDEDGDGNNWGDTNQIGDGMGGFTTPPSLISRSWAGSPLTPDNWAVSPAIDLTNASGTITLEYITQVAAESWDEEKYSLYISTSDDISVLTTLTADLTETLGDLNNTGTPVNHTFDMSSYAGQTVYVVLRHWDCTDQDFLAVHSMEVTASTLNVDVFDVTNFDYFVDSSNRLNLSANQTFEKLTIHNLLGQEVLSQQLNAQDENVDLSNLNSGVYLAQVKINGVSKTVKILKK